ncbi:hypothetical protein [Novosphingobium terrae]|uniref:hypothetical protein n=1 Tax=Novosphingobium terrae TaxID=2726189 RepID=UPI00197D8445|nr:hypothetical protein [Novosphingobium terrae]
MTEIIIPNNANLIKPTVYSTVIDSAKSDRLFRTSWNSALSNRFMNDITVHGDMLDQVTPSNRPTFPIYYVRTSTDAPPAASSSLDTPINLLAEQYYQKVQSQLFELRELSDTDNEVVERGAVDTALNVLEQLHEHHLAPPEISHHGGDAVVMLWALGSSTYAITITEGEVGWVVRRDRREISSKDSIKVENFQLLDSR